MRVIHLFDIDTTKNGSEIYKPSYARYFIGCEPNLKALVGAARFVKKLPLAIKRYDLRINHIAKDKITRFTFKNDTKELVFEDTPTGFNCVFRDTNYIERYKAFSMYEFWDKFKRSNIKL